MPNNIRNVVTVKGLQADVDLFEKYLQSQITDTGYGRTADFGDDVDITGEGPDELEFAMTTGWSPNVKWLDQMRTQFPTLKFTLFWTDEDDTPSYGYIDENGNEYGIGGSIKEFIEVAKRDKQYEKTQNNFTSLDTINSLLQRGFISRWEIDPSLQTWAVPDGQLPSFRPDPNNPIKILTFYAPPNVYNPNEQVYYVKARYDSATNRISPV